MYLYLYLYLYLSPHLSQRGRQRGRWCWESASRTLQLQSSSVRPKKSTRERSVDAWFWCFSKLKMKAMARYTFIKRIERCLSNGKFPFHVHVSSDNPRLRVLGRSLQCKLRDSWGQLRFSTLKTSRRRWKKVFQKIWTYFAKKCIIIDNLNENHNCTKCTNRY